VVSAAQLIQGGLPRVARSEAGLMRALAAAQFEDGGLMSRSPEEQMLLVDRLGLLRDAYFAAKQSLPDALESAAAAALAALHGVTMGDGGLSSWQGGNPGDPARIAALIEGCGLRARPLRQARGWGYQRLSALGTILVIDAAPPPPAKMVSGSASTLAFELSDGAQRLIERILRIEDPRKIVHGPERRGIEELDDLRRLIRIQIQRGQLDHEGSRVGIVAGCHPLQVERRRQHGVTPAAAPRCISTRSRSAWAGR
jgi:hypothetical protein